jgi:AraC-like DNA-binding protein
VDGPAPPPRGPAPESRVLFRRGGYGLARHRCSAPAAHGSEEVTTRPEIVLVRAGGFLYSGARGRHLADAHQVLFLNAGEPYRVDHPAGGDDCLVLKLPAAELREALIAAGERCADDPQAPFTRLAAAAPLELAPPLLELVRAAAEEPEPLALQEAILTLSRRLLAAGGPPPSRAAHAATRRLHDEQVEAARLLLLRRLDERLDLATVARAANASAFHLARLFRRSTGMSLHAYLVALRLRHALDALADGEPDLADLAARLGFADHAHLTTRFRRAFGMTPSEFRRRASRAGRRQSLPAAVGSRSSDAT